MLARKIFLGLLLGIALLAFFGGNSLVSADQNDPPHDTHLWADRGPQLAQLADHCTVCHTGTPDWNNVDTARCDPCHSPDGAYNGVNDSAVGALNNWQNRGNSADASESLIYESDGTLKSGKERWCAACHDDGISFSKPQIVPDVIVDNEDSALFSVTGTWNIWDTNCIYVGENFHWHPEDLTESYSATWQVPADMQAGTYRVYAIWCANAYREENVYYTINDGNGPHEVGPFNQKQNGGIWVDLGEEDELTFTFNEGAGSVVLSGEDSNGIVHAEAIKFENVDYAGAYAPNVLGNDVDYGYFVTGHKLNCTVCHDTTSHHIDHNPRTYEIEEPHTVVNAYEDGYRLADVAGGRPMVVPRDPTPGSQDVEPSDFALCFTCHDAVAILDVSPLGTNFYNDDSTPQNSHWIHLRMSGRFCDSDWDAIIGGANGASHDSAPTCTTCHNVHGSFRPMMIRHGELISTADVDKIPALDFCYADKKPEDLEDQEQAEDARNCDIETAYPSSVGGSMNCQGAFPEGGNGVCKNCHTGYINYYRTPKNIAMPAIGKGHDIHLSSDNRGPGITECTDCHDPGSYSLFSDGEPLAITEACDTCHSPLGAFPADLDDADVGAKANWAEGIYEEDGITLKAGKEEWCSTCHDGGTAFSRAQIVPDVIVDNEDPEFSVDAGTWLTWTQNCIYVGNNFQYHLAGTEYYQVTWQVPVDMPAGEYRVYAIWCANSYREDEVSYTINDKNGSHVVEFFNQKQDNGIWVDLGKETQTFTFDAGSGSVVLSGSNNDGIVHAEAVKFVNLDYAGAYAPNVVGDHADYGYYINGHKLDCAVCHDLSKKHIDHNPRTYEVNETTMEEVNTYEDGYRLRDLLGQRPMVVPRVAVPGVIDLDPSEFALCFKCHDANAILHYSPDGSNFYNDDSRPQNSHWIHLRMSGRFCDSDWDAIIGGSNGASMDSGPTCTTCHDVHGSVSATMLRHGEKISTEGNDKTPALDFAYLNSSDVRDSTITSAYDLSIGGSMILSGYPEGGNGVCKVCHTGDFRYHRTPKLIEKPKSPVVSSALAEPSNIANDGTGSILFTAYVVDPNYDLDTVTINLSELGVSGEQAMYDDGETAGDETAGDEIYSYLLEGGTTVGLGNKTVTITATDSDIPSNTGTGEVVVVVHDEYGAYIVDNEDRNLFSVTGSWETWDENCVHFGTHFHYHPGRPVRPGGPYSATWQVRSDMPAGEYRVYAIWCANSYRENEVSYTINHAGGPTVVEFFDQRLNNGVWVDLGKENQTFTFNAGSGSVVVSGDENDGIVGAEAIMWEPVPE